MPLEKHNCHWNWNNPETEVENPKPPMYLAPFPCHYPGITQRAIDCFIDMCPRDSVLIISTGCGYDGQKTQDGEDIPHAADRQGMLERGQKNVLAKNIMVFRMNSIPAVELYNHCSNLGMKVTMIFHTAC